jgi:RNA polymerase sigma factor (sigma-70 family)
VLAFIRAKNDTPEQDMDILQDAMMTAYTQVERGRYKPRVGVSFAAYVKGIALNKIREARRRTRRFIPLHDGAEYIPDSVATGLDAVVERQERWALLCSGLSALPPCRRQVLESYLGGQTTTEIAQALNMSEASVRQHKSRGLRVLRSNLKLMGLVTSHR